MNRFQCSLLVLALATVGLVACGDPSSSPATVSPEALDGVAGHDHDNAPHGGHVVVLGDHVAHLEIAHGEGSDLVLYALDVDMQPAAFDVAPVLSLVTDDGSVTVTGVAVADDGWRMGHDALADPDVKGRFRLKVGGKTYTPDFAAHDHHAGAGMHGPHDGTTAAFLGMGGIPGGKLELKLHDDKGDLELWLGTSEGIDHPFDVPLDTRVQVVFADHGGRSVELAVRDRETNEDEDGTGNIRARKTNYFIFPGATGADAAWLQGADFHSQVVVSFMIGGVHFTSESFDLRPHTHAAGHDHAGHAHDEDPDTDDE